MTTEIDSAGRSLYRCVWCSRTWRDEGALLFHHAKVHGIDLPLAPDCEHHFPYRMLSVTTDMATCAKCGYEATGMELVQKGWTRVEH